MSWLKKAKISVSQVPSAEEILTGLVNKSISVPAAIDQLSRMVSPNDGSVCDQIGSFLGAIINSGSNPEVVRSIEMVKNKVCVEGQQKSMPQQPVPNNQNDIPPVENPNIPQSEEFV